MQMPDYPCRNPHCKSYGHPHPNCECGAEDGRYALGGAVCTGMHRAECEHYADGGQVTDNMQMETPGYAVEHVAASKGLLHLLTKTGHTEAPEASSQFMNHARQGHKSAKTSAKAIFDGSNAQPEARDVTALSNHLNSVREQPEQMLNIGGNLGEHLPGHALQLAATGGAAVSYLESIKPKPQQLSPLDPIMPPDKASQAAYVRQLGVAENPLAIMHLAKMGRLEPNDMKTLMTIYPHLAQSFAQKATEELIAASSGGKRLSYVQKQGLGTLLGRPLDSTLTPAAMQAIITSQGPQQAQQQAKGGQKRPSAAELKTLDQTDKLYETPQEARLANKKE